MARGAATTGPRSCSILLENLLAAAQLGLAVGRRKWRGWTILPLFCVYASSSTRHARLDLLCGESDRSHALLREVAEVAYTAQSWHIEGSMEESGTHCQPASFTLVMRSNNQTRFQQIGGSTPVTIVCGSGGGNWVYSPPLNRYRTLRSPDDPVCSQVVGDWKSMPVGLKSPAAAGHKVIELGNQVVDCSLVRGYSEPELPSAGRVKRTLCIDVSRHLIVWERAETKYGSRTYTYSRIERNADVPADAFIFDPPPQSRQTPYQLPIPRPEGSRSMPPDPDVSLPKLVSRKDPVY